VIVDRVPAPTLVYRHGEHLIAVTELPAGASRARSGAPAETIDGFHVARWSDQNLSYVAVSDIDEQTLAAFVEAFRQALKPTAEAPAQ
jgi:anti-sigma factor RsiW